MWVLTFEDQFQRCRGKGAVFKLFYLGTVGMKVLGITNASDYLGCKI